MSYSFGVTAKDNVLTISGQTTEVPDGQYNVSGHDDATDRSISVARYQPGPGLVVAQASAAARRVD